MEQITINNLNIFELDTYLKNGQSILGKTIFDWCKRYIEDVSDINNNYVANEIYKNYFLDSVYRPNLNSYYYLINSSINYNGRLYSLEKDHILSPNYDKLKRTIQYKDINKLINDICKNKNIICSDKHMIEYDLKCIDKSFNLLKYRLKLLNVNQNSIKDKFNSFTNYKKYQIYNIYKDTLIDMKTIKNNIW